MRSRHCPWHCQQGIQDNVGTKQPKRTRAELVALLADQRSALAASCEGYDKGNEWEAARLATTIYTVVHDSTDSSITSILTQLGQRAQLRFVSSGRAEPRPGVVSSPPLLNMTWLPGKGITFEPCLDRGQQKEVEFEAWWDKEFIYTDKSGAGLTRKRLIFSLRNQDGGSHIGELTDPHYVRLKSGAGFIAFGGSSPPKPMDTAAATTVRQIAWEVTETLKQLDKIDG